MGNGRRDSGREGCDMLGRVGVTAGVEAYVS